MQRTNYKESPTDIAVTFGLVIVGGIIGYVIGYFIAMHQVNALLASDAQFTKSYCKVFDETGLAERQSRIDAGASVDSTIGDFCLETSTRTVSRSQLIQTKTNNLAIYTVIVGAGAGFTMAIIYSDKQHKLHRNL